MVSGPGQGASPGARCAAAPGPADASPGAAAWAMLCWEARPAGRWAVPEGAREGRTPPIGVSNNANDPAGVTDPHPSIPTSNRGRAAGRRTMGLRRQGAALARNAWGWEGHRDGPRAAGESLARPCGPPDRRSCGLPVLLPHDWANMGQLGRSGSSRQQCGHTRSIPRSAQPAPVAPTYTPRSDGSGPNWETLRPQVGPGVVTRTRPPDSAAGLRADGQTREAREST